MTEKTENGDADSNFENNSAQQASAVTGFTRHKAPAHAKPDTSTLQKRIKGEVLTASDSNFEKVALDVWNKYGLSERRPQVIVRVANEQDVVEAVKFARAGKLKVTVRGGGHNWCNPSLRNGTRNAWICSSRLSPDITSENRTP